MRRKLIMAKMHKNSCYYNYCRGFLRFSCTLHSGVSPLCLYSYFTPFFLGNVIQERLQHLNAWGFLLNLYPNRHTTVTTCLLNITIWLSHREFKLSLLKMKLNSNRSPSLLPLNSSLITKSASPLILTMINFIIIH